MTALILPRPTLDEGCFASVPVFTDEALFEACGVRIAFTMREGGVSEGPYASLNLGSHVQDVLDKVLQNRALLFSALAPSLEESEQALIVPKQVHGDTVLTVGAAREVARVQRAAAEGADGIIVSAHEVGALLCFADCMPVIIVLPTGRFAVVHAGAVSRTRSQRKRSASCSTKSARSTALVEVSLQPKLMSISALISIANALKRAQMFMPFSLRSSVRSAVSMRHISIWELPCAFSLLRAASTLRVSAIWAVVRYVRMIASSPSERKMACRVATVRSRSVSNVVYGSAACPRPFLGCDIVG